MTAWTMRASRSSPRDGARRASGMPFRPPSAAPSQADPTPSSPPGFHRRPDAGHAYTPFEAFLILDDLDGFYRETPHMPAALVSHDVLHEDWIRFMQVSFEYDNTRWCTVF